jgi:hypothetical protein
MKYQNYTPFDCTTVTNYVAWASGIGTALSALGWTRTGDLGQVTWGNVNTLPATSTPQATNFTFVGAWAGGTGYAGQATTGSLGAVSYSGLTYECIMGTLNVGFITAIVGAASTFTITAVAGSSSNQAVYTVSATVTSAVLGQQFIVTVGGSNLLPQNTGTYICTAFTTTSITLTSSIAVAQASVTGGTPGAQMISSTGITTFKLASSISILGTSVGNGLAGHSVIVSGFTGGGIGDNGTFTVISSGSDASSSSYFSTSLSGVSSATGAGGLIGENTPPSSDPLHWIPYNYEIWKSTDALSGTLPLYLRLVYGRNGNNNPYINFIVGTGTTGTGWVTGNYFSGSAAPTEFFYSPSGSPMGNSTFDSDYCVSTSGGSLSIALFRGTGTSNPAGPFHLIIDRAKDNFGNELDTYVTCLATGCSGGGANSGGYQLLFKPGTGTTMPTGSSWGGWPAITNLQTSSLNANGLSAILPIFPIPGYLANPCLGAIMMKVNDCADGQFVTAYMYGGQHTFVMSKSTGATNQGSQCAIGTRFE